ncbi:MAG: rhomboid family intramembrane serine protease [Phenylobacterium sp.]|uniref:rhomboid family intramembrane serine protease n=1 Tax=Phenylobacterium sp. TaxID=1871053 RepID=UPI003919D974
MSAERQPIFNAPWTSLMLAAVIVGGYALQRTTDQEALIGAFAFAPQDIAAGRWETAITSLFLHGAWAHALLNAAGALAFGTPVARYFGLRPRGVAFFFLFYLACGALASLGYGWLHAAGGVLLIGASGAVSGLMGAAVRILGGRGVPGGFLTPPVIGMTLAWVGVNLLLGILGIAPGMGEASIAWEAHLIGYAAGLFLIDLFGWMAGARRSAQSY